MTASSPNRPPLLTLALTSYNYAPLLPAALDAVLAQQPAADEIIVIDDASIDASWGVIEEYAARHPGIRAIRNPENRGVVANLNAALDLCRTPYLAYAAADDRILPGLFHTALDLLERHPQAGLFTAPAAVMAPSGEATGARLGVAFPAGSWHDPSQALDLLRRYGLCIVGSTTVFRRERLVQAGGFDPGLGPIADSFVSQVMALRHGFCSSPEPLALVRMSEHSYSQRLKRDMASSLDLMARVSRAMRQGFPGLFPEDFVSSWEARWRFSVFNEAWEHEVLGPQARFTGRYLPLLGRGDRLLDRVFALGLSLCSRAQAWLVRGYAAWVFRTRGGQPR